MRKKFLIPAAAILLLAFTASLFYPGCKHESTKQSAEQNQTVQPPALQKPSFQADSAYAYIAAQVAFGPRVPGTPAQRKCADWMKDKLNSFCDTVFVQDVKVKAGDGKMLPCINLIGAINPAATKRVLLIAHWDCRPWADEDAVRPNEPVDGADDGASGVGVLLELARQIKTQPLPDDLGVDILFTDVEDYGKDEWDGGEGDSYALGTQYWARNPHVPGYKASFGILLDMVGAFNARFPLEGTSTEYAASYQQQVWKAAGTAGYSSYFPFAGGPKIIDDHVFINKYAGIPTIDIIHLTNTTPTSFPPHWHTHQDNMSIIDKNTLKAVGETLLQVIYELAQPGA